MTLMTILICLAWQRYSHFSLLLHKANGPLLYTSIFTSLFTRVPLLNSILGICVFVLPLIMITGILDYVLYGRWYNSVWFLFHLLVLFYCLDAHNLKRRFADYFSTYRNNTSEECHYDVVFQEDIVTDDKATLIRDVTKTIFLHADQFIFAILFWYVILGPVGAVLYYAVNHLYQKHKANELLLPLARIAATIQAILDWLPVRIAGLTYALVGHFSNAFSYWWRHLRTGLAHTKELAFNTGLAALELDKVTSGQAEIGENQQALTLVDRALIIWIIIIAIFTLGAWIS